MDQADQPKARIKSKLIKMIKEGLKHIDLEAGKIQRLKEDKGLKDS